VTFKYDADDNLTSANASFSSVTIKDVRETITIKATLKVALTYDARNDTFKLSGSDNFTSISSVYDDRSKWSLSVATVSSYSYDSATDKGTSSRSETFTGFSTSDSVGNSAAFNGKIAYTPLRTTTIRDSSLQQVSNRRLYVQRKWPQTDLQRHF
jgi:hypothetical protein